MLQTLLAGRETASLQLTAPLPEGVALHLAIRPSQHMGVELHITRAEHWAENEGAEISAEDWMKYIESDPEFVLDAKNGQYFALWKGPSKYEEPWLDWFNGNISTKWPDTALYEKMLRVAQALGAKVQDDDGTDYVKAGDWAYDPTERVEAYKKEARVTWWQRFLSRK